MEDIQYTLGGRCHVEEDMEQSFEHEALKMVKQFAAAQIPERRAGLGCIVLPLALSTCALMRDVGVVRTRAHSRRA